MPRHGAPHHLPRWLRRSLDTLGLALLASGAAWLALHYTVGGAVELPHPAEPWLMRLHGALAFGGLFVFGALAAAHLPAGWRMSARPQHAGQRGTGLALGALSLVLIVTSYALYYFAPETLRAALGLAHTAAGAVMAVVVVVHRRQRRRLARHGARA